MSRNEVRGLAKDLSDSNTHLVRARPTHQNGKTRVAQTYAPKALYPAPYISQALTHNPRSHVMPTSQPASVSSQNMAAYCLPYQFPHQPLD